MITVHHLNNSRSQRVLWLLEELEVPYELVQHRRDPQTNLAPPSLLAVHPLGKSPLIVDDGEVVLESGAILEHLVRRNGKGRLMPPEPSPEHTLYLQLMHYAEGSAMLPLMMTLYLRRLGDASGPLLPRVESEFQRHVGWLDSLLEDREFFVGRELTAADVQLSFVVQLARILYGLERFPRLAAFLDRIHARPAYRRALERGGTYGLGG